MIAQRQKLIRLTKKWARQRSRKKTSIFAKFFYGVGIIVIDIFAALIVAPYYWFEHPAMSFKEMALVTRKGKFEEAYTEHLKIRRMSLAAFFLVTWSTIAVVWFAVLVLAI